MLSLSLSDGCLLCDHRIVCRICHKIDGNGTKVFMFRFCLLLYLNGHILFLFARLSSTKLEKEEERNKDIFSFGLRRFVHSSRCSSSFLLHAKYTDPHTQCDKNTSALNFVLFMMYNMYDARRD